jgi:hypothetical protein
MKRSLSKISIYCSLFLSLAGTVNAQDTTVKAEFKPGGKLWGYAFGDYAWKGASDEMNRGGSNQYTNIPLNANLFQWRRIYLGYDYQISEKFSAEFLLAAEDDWAGGVLGQPAAAVTVNTLTGTSTKVGLGNNGDVLLNNKFSPYVKLCNVRWKNIWHNTDLVIGQSATPTFAKNGSGMASEEVWGYRSIERTITDIRRTSSYDFGIALQGKFDNNGNFGYVLMAANGQGAKPENDNYKWFYGDVWAKFAEKRIIVDISQDYAKLHWGVWVKGLNGPWYHDRNMTKLFAAYVNKKFTVGAEVFMNTLMGDVAVTGVDKSTYYRTTKATGVSVFVKGRITENKLGFFARFDNYDPSGNLKNIVDDANTKSYSASTSQYEPTTKEMFTTFGIDFTPIKNMHIMPNIWLNTYTSALDPAGKNSAGTAYASMYKDVASTSLTGNIKSDGMSADVAYRLTFYYIFGK